MAKKRTSKMVVEKTRQSDSFGFSTDKFSIETNKTLLQYKTMTFSAVVARQLGYTQGVMTLTLVWKGNHLLVRFTRDNHPGGGWRSCKEDFAKFFDVVGFKKNQGYSVFQVPGLGNYAFEFEKSWEYFPRGGTIEIPEMRRGRRSPEAGVHGGVANIGEPSEPPSGSDVMLWRRPTVARKTSGSSVGMLKKRKPRMRTGGRVGAKVAQGSVAGTSSGTSGRKKIKKDLNMLARIGDTGKDADGEAPNAAAKEVNKEPCWA